MRPRPRSRIFCPTRSRPGVSYPLDCRPAPRSARCWPPASRSAPRRAVATSISAAPRTGARGSSGRPRSSPAISRSGWATATAASTWTASPARRPRARTGAPRRLQRDRHLLADRGDVFQLSVSRATEPSRGVLRRLVLHSRDPAGSILAQPAPFRLSPDRRRAKLRRSGTSTSIPSPDGNLIAHLYESAAVANFDQTNPIPVPVATVGPLRDLLPQGERTRQGASRSGRTASRSSTTRTWRRLRPTCSSGTLAVGRMTSRRRRRRSISMTRRSAWRASVWDNDRTVGGGARAD